MHDPYLYPNTDILINKYNIKDSKLLAEMEAEYTSIRLSEIIENPLKGEYDFKHFCQFHKWIFQDIYEWAGKPRVIDIEKSELSLGGLSIEYENYENIEKATEKILKDMKSINWEELNIDEKAIEFSNYVAELWKIHSFREGNTRTTITFCCQFAESRGFILDRTLFEKNSVYLRNSLVAATAIFTDIGDYRKKEYLYKIIKDSLEKGLNQEFKAVKSLSEYKKIIGSEKENKNEVYSKIKKTDRER